MPPDPPIRAITAAEYRSARIVAQLLGTDRRGLLRPSENVIDVFQAGALTAEFGSSQHHSMRV